MFRLFRVIGLFLQGRFSEMGKAWNTNKYVVTATYDQAIKKNAGRYEQLRDAVAELIRLEEDKKEELKGVTTRIQKLSDIQAGAVAKAKKVAADLKAQGKGKAEIEANAEYIKWMKAYQDATGELESIEERADTLEAEIAQSQKQLGQYKAELASMQRTKDSLEREKQETQADIAIAERTRAVNDLLAGVTKDTTDSDLAQVREARKKARAQAKLSAELSGTDAKAQEEELLREASTSKAASVFSDLIGLEDEPAEKLDPAKLPE